MRWLISPVILGCLPFRKPKGSNGYKVVQGGTGGYRVVQGTA